MERTTSCMPKISFNLTHFVGFNMSSSKCWRQLSALPRSESTNPVAINGSEYLVLSDRKVLCTFDVIRNQWTTSPIHSRIRGSSPSLSFSFCPDAIAYDQGTNTLFVRNGATHCHGLVPLDQQRESIPMICGIFN